MLGSTHIHTYGLDIPYIITQAARKPGKSSIIGQSSQLYIPIELITYSVGPL